MNALIVLAAILSVASAVPYAAPIYSSGYAIKSYAAAPLVAAPIVKSYAAAPIISHATYAAPVVAAPIVKSYAAPIVTKSYIGSPLLAGPAVYGAGLGYGYGVGHGLYGGYGKVLY